jgi:hypothetical protein
LRRGSNELVTAGRNRSHIAAVASKYTAAPTANVTVAAFGNCHTPPSVISTGNVCSDSEKTADKDWIAAMNAAGRRRATFVEIIFCHVRRVLFRGHETISDNALLTGWEFHQ